MSSEENLGRRRHRRGRESIMPRRRRSRGGENRAPNGFTACTELLAVAALAPIAERVGELVDRAAAATEHTATELRRRAGS
jgi:hypothetical protein